MGMGNNGGLLDFEDEETENYDGGAADTVEDDDIDSRDDGYMDDEDDGVDLKELLDAGDYGKDDDDPDTEEEPEPEQPEDDSEEEVPAEQEQEQESEEDQAFKNEENARNAERRRQNEQRMLEKIRSESPEFALAQVVSEHFGKPVDQVLQEIQTANAQREAAKMGIPLEVFQRLQDLEQREVQREYQLWQSRIQQESASLKESYPMLSEEDFKAAEGYILQTQKLDMPLEEAVLAKHGKKILESQREALKNEALAQVSGRKSRTAAPPKAGTSSTDGSEVLTSAERAAARALGVTEKEYLKYRA